MISRLLFLGFLVAAPGVAEEIPRAVQVAEPPEPLQLAGHERVISSTEQFRVTGGAAGDRATAALLAEEAKDELLRLTGERLLKTDEKYAWKVPVAIALHGKQGDPMPPRTAALRIHVSELGWNVRLDYHLSRGLEHEPLKAAVTAALVYERGLRGLPTSETESPFNVPPWLVDGLREATAWRLNQSDRRRYETLFRTGGLFKIDEIFSLTARGHEEMDAAMRAAFRVSSGALVMALLQQPEGLGGFRSFLEDVAPFQGEMPALLRKHFPELNLSETSLAKWWALQLANIGGQNLATDVLPVLQTETALTEALRLNFRTPEGIIQQKELSAWPELAALPAPERANSIKLAEDALVRLSYRCFPSYRPILAEYQTILTAVAKNETDDIAARLAALDERRAVMTAKAARARDYLDWFEITRARETSGEFDDYMRLKERLESNPHRRDDKLSQYLDRMDAIFSRGDVPAPANVPPVQNPLLLPE